MYSKFLSIVYLYYCVMASPKSFLDFFFLSLWLIQNSRVLRYGFSKIFLGFFFHHYDLFKILEYRVPLLLRYGFSKIKRIFVFLGGRGGMKIPKRSTVFLLLKKGMWEILNNFKITMVIRETANWSWSSFPLAFRVHILILRAVSLNIHSILIHTWLISNPIDFSQLRRSSKY